MSPLRWFLCCIAVVWLVVEWALALPPMIHQGFGPWHRVAWQHLRADTGFQLIAADYLLAYLIAFVLSVHDAKHKTPRHWVVWTIGFLLATAPAMLFYWACRPRTAKR